MPIAQDVYDAVLQAGGCTATQGKGLCRRACDKGQKLCPHHLALEQGKKHAEHQKFLAAQLNRRLERGA